MARGRMISKAISLDEKVDSLSSDTCRLLFTWLVTHLDCEGRMYGDAQTVKSIVFPRRNIKPATIEKYLQELETAGLIVRYFGTDTAPKNAGTSVASEKNEGLRRRAVPQNTYLLCPKFERHQPGLQKSRESQSQIPAPTPELLQSNVGNSLPETKTKTKTKEEHSSSNVSTEDVKDVFQRNLGDLSEDMESEVVLACEKFSAPWVIEAISEAVRHNKRNWAYVAGVLKNWQRYGKNGKPKARSPDRYTKGKYGHMVQQ